MRPEADALCWWPAATMGDAEKSMGRCIEDIWSGGGGIGIVSGATGASPVGGGDEAGGGG